MVIIILFTNTPKNERRCPKDSFSTGVRFCLAVVVKFWKSLSLLELMGKMSPYFNTCGYYDIRNFSLCLIKFPLCRI